MNHSIFYSEDRSILFHTVGDGNNLYLCTPFYPFNTKYFINLFQNIKSESITFIIPELPSNSSKFKKSVLFNTLSETIMNSISFDKYSTVNTIGFGIFANLSLHITSILIEKISSVLMIEPDFTNIVLDSIFIKGKKRFFVSPENILKYYIGKSNHEKFTTLVVKPNPSALYNYNKSSKDHGIKELILKRTLETDINFTVLWSAMSAESWPLAQVFEENSVSLINPGEPVVKMIIHNDNKILRIISNAITK